jgi:hypothetical protein
MLQKNAFCQFFFSNFMHGFKSAILAKLKKHVPGSAKSRIYKGKSAKRGFSKKGLARIEFFFLVCLSKAWNAKLEAGIFLAV